MTGLVQSYLRCVAVGDLLIEKRGHVAESSEELVSIGTENGKETDQ